jgi:hypothetical protein
LRIYYEEDHDGMNFGIGNIVQTCFKNTIMKKYMYTPVLVMLFTALMTVRAQDRQEEYLGLPGDNLNLYAVMKLFQESETLEGFERKLNAEDSRINNLDLNGDGYVDYIRVIDNVDRNVHYIVLQVAISSRENQDVAVFTVWREDGGQVQIQLAGDEALYGRNYIIEPIFDETPNPGYTGNTRTINGQNVIVNRTTTVEIAAWPLVRFIFLPTYVVWHSPWYYSYYPSYWRPWSPFYWHYYYGYHYNYYSYYYGHYRHWDHYRNPYWQDSYYSNRRAYSPVVHDRIQEGRYKTTYSHPEQRSEGIASYRRTNQDQNARSSNQSSAGTAVRRSASESGTGRQTTTSGTERRPATTGTTRQSASTSNEKRPATTGTIRRSISTSTERRSTAIGTDRSGTKPHSEQKATGTQTNRRSSATGTSTSGRRSSGSNKATTTGRSAERTQESKTTKDSGRR